MNKLSLSRRLIAIILALSLLCSLGVSVFADTGDNETTSGDQDAKTVVWVSAEAATFKVTVPSALAFSIAADGTVTAPSNLEIANESNGPVYVSDVTVNADCQWAIDANGQDYQTVPVNSKRLTLTLNSTNAPATAVGNESSFGTLSRDDGYWPVIMGNDSLDITAAADFAEQGTALTTPQSVVHVIYTIAWHTEDDGIDDGTTSTPTTTHTVSYNANGSTGTMASASVESGNQYQIAANTFANGTKTFTGWATSADGQVVYAPRAKFTVTDDVELFAKWAAVTYTVTFVTGEGSAVEPQSVEEGSTAVRPSDPTRTDYEFGGWYTDSSYKTEFDFSTVIVGATSIYAKWDRPIAVVATFRITSVPSTVSLDNFSSVNIDWGDGSETAADTSHEYTTKGSYTVKIGAQNGKILDIPSNAFNAMTNLTDVKIRDSVTSIGGRAFYGCTSLRSITVPDSVTSMGQYVFGTCSGLNSVIIGGGAASGSNTFYQCRSIGSVTFLDGVTSIGDSLFRECTGLTSIEIPDGVTSIGERAFENCRALRNVTIPESLTSIGKSAFLYCESLTNIVIPDNVTNIGREAFNCCTDLTNATIGNGVTSIESGTFSGCESLKSVTIPDSVTSIGYGAFSGCKSLTDITIPSSVASIEDQAFLSCSGLTGVTIRNGVTSIGESAFADCTSLTSVTIPNSVTSIGRGAFGDCDELTNVNMLPTTPPTLGTNAFGYTDLLADGFTITVPSGSLSGYQSATGWSDYADKMVESS